MPTPPDHLDRQSAIRRYSVLVYWEPLSSANAEAFDQFRAFVELMWTVPSSDRPDWIWGVGFVTAADRGEPGETYPLVLVDADLVPYDPEQEAAARSGADLVYVHARRTVLEVLDLQGPSALTLLPERARVLPVTRPQPLALTSGDPIRDTVAPHPRGTVGLPVEWEDSWSDSHDGYITAGHCARGGVGSTFEAIHRRTLMPATYSPAGTVAFHSDPATMPGVAGYDVAVVDHSTSVSGPARTGVARLNGLLPMPEPVDVYGGNSGAVPAELVGAMMAVGDPATRMWTDSWLVVPSGVTVQGDSGSAVILDQEQDAAAMIVGEARRKNLSRTPLVQFAHDLESLVDNYLTLNHVRLL